MAEVGDGVEIDSLWVYVVDGRDNRKMSETPVEFWDAQAASFDNAVDHGLTNEVARNAWRRLLSIALPPPPGRVVDLGCGTGTISLLMAELGYRVDGLDFSPAMIERAQAKTDRRTEVEFHLGDASAPALPKGSFDVVLSRHVLWALPDPAAALERWVALLAPNGRLVLIEGRWATGSGLRAAEAESLLRSIGRDSDLVDLPDPDLWGQEIVDERYMIVSTGAA